MATAIHVLIIEDNDALRETLADVLVSSGFAVTAIASGEELLEMTQAKYNIAILDLNLPGEDGLSIAARLRRVQASIGIIMLTVRHAVTDKLAGYENGADVYLAKPVSTEELIAVVKSLSRRLASVQPHATLPTLDTKTSSLRLGGVRIRLRDTERQLLQAFALAADGQLETWQILEALHKPLDDQGRRQLAVIVTRLRAKLESSGITSPAIRAVRGIGYQCTFDIIIQ
ncbi:response regulator transcription factor [Methylophaga lonarensis]|uniref:response regulator transcription factor n=1 Tax=Methylophaga lonarensis TaxID=999151 RepID=UPI003D296DFE